MCRKILMFPRQQHVYFTSLTFVVVINLIQSRSSTLLPISRIDRILKLPLSPVRPLLHALVLLLTEHFGLGNDLRRRSRIRIHRSATAIETSRLHLAGDKHVR
jgi:hypothetical protein